MGNVVSDGIANTSIAALDHLPFSEMIAKVDQSQDGIDVLLATPGGSAEQVIYFNNALRARFKSVDFLIPYKAMSAGTLWALAGDRIWMDSRAFLGPIDPQVPSKDGRFIPLQALLTLLTMIQHEGQKALAQGQQPPWSLVLLLREMDQKQVGHALTATKYVATMAAQYLEQYKFKAWASHKSGAAVTLQERQSRAAEVADLLCSHDRWKAHGHAITREDLESEVRIKIDRPESVPGLERALRRFWALAYYCFDKSPVAKMFLSQNYVVIRNDLKALTGG